MLLVGLLLSGAASAIVAADVREERSVQFRAASERAELVVQDRVDSVVSVHEVMRDAVGAAWPLSRQQFHDIVAGPQGANPFGDVQAVSFNRRIQASEVARFEREVAADASLNGVGYPGFTVRPEETAFDDRIVVDYIEPFEGNEAAFGFDIGAVPTRRAAVEEARDSGRLVATEPITLVQETGDQRGFLLISPVYDTPGELVSGPSRRRHFVGVVVTVVRTGDLFDDALEADPLVDLEIYDLGRIVEDSDPEFGEETLVFDERGERFVAQDGSVDDESIAHDVNVGSRRWRLVTRLADPAPLLPINGLLAFVAGAAITAAIAFALRTALRARQRAEKLADERTTDLRLLVASAPDATVVVDEAGIIVLASDQVEALLGHDPASLIGKPVETLVPEPVRGGHVEHRARFMLAPERRSMGGGMELDALHADGSTVPVEISLSPLASESFGAVVASLRDVTIRRAAMHELETANRMKSSFLATISHELRTPLVAIAGFARLLRDREDELRSDHVQLVERIADNSTHLRQLVEDLIAYSRLESEAAPLDPAPREARSLLDDAVESLRPVLADRTIDVRGPDVPVHVDVLAFRRMIANLLTNADRYSPAGLPITITVEEGSDGTTLVHVDDSGPGVPEVEREHVFDRFFRGDLARQRAVTGTGIGLAVVRSLARASGGDVWVTDAETGGARFTLALPSYEPPAQRMSSSTSSGTMSPPSSAAGEALPTDA